MPLDYLALKHFLRYLCRSLRSVLNLEPSSPEPNVSHELPDADVATVEPATEVRSAATLAHEPPCA